MLDSVHLRRWESSTKHTNERSLWATGHNRMWCNLRASVPLFRFTVEVTHSGLQRFCLNYKPSGVLLKFKNFCPDLNTVVPKEYSFHKVAPQDHRDCAGHWRASHPGPRGALELEKFETKGFILAFKGAPHLARDKFLGPVVLACRGSFKILN